MLKVLLKSLVLYFILIPRFCISSYGEVIPIETAWYGIYGLIYAGSDKNIKLNDIYKVKRGEEIIGEFQIIEVKKNYSKGKFSPSKEGLEILKDDLVILEKGQLPHSEVRNAIIVNQTEVKKQEDKKGEEQELLIINEKKDDIKEEIKLNNEKSEQEFEVGVEIILPNRIFCFKTIEEIKEGMVFIIKRGDEEIGEIEITKIHPKFTQAKIIYTKVETTLIKGERLKLIKI